MSTPRFASRTDNAGTSQPFAPVVVTASGLVRGEALATTLVYRGIPYAAPPTGHRRWRPPSPPKPWRTPRDARRFAPICPQVTTTQGRIVLNPWQKEVVAGDEDCLALNIWVPRESEGLPLPVMVFIHGGGHVWGAGSHYDGAGLAERGVVVVTLNYRLGVFGFLAHPALSKEDPEYRTSGNYGLLDQIAALRWVQENIRAFSGDPDRVTLFGESAGAASICALMASPLTRGLFHRVILESGTCLTRRTLRDAEEYGLRFAASAGCGNQADAPECLRRKTPDELLKILRPPTVFPELFEILAGGHAFGPLIDGSVLPSPPLQVIRSGKHDAVPVIIGTNANEGSLFLTGSGVWNGATYQASVVRVFGKRAACLLELYPVSKYKSPREAYEALLTDLAFVCPARAFARALAARRSKVFVYQFAHTVQSGWFRSLGAFHGLELAFVFRFGSMPALRPTVEERALSDTVADYWTQFARTGVPNARGLPHWPEYALDEDQYQVLKSPVRTAIGFGGKACQDLLLKDLVD